MRTKQTDQIFNVFMKRPSGLATVKNVHTIIQKMLC